MSDERDRPGREPGRPHEAGAGAAEPDAFWKRSYAGLEYTDAGKSYDYYRPAFRFGWEWARRRPVPFSEAESELRSAWAEPGGMDWEEAKPAVRDAFRREANTSEADPGNPLV